MSVRVTTPSRVHIGLIDLNASIGRIDGGIGIALEEPRIRLRAEPAEGIEVTGPLAERASAAAKRTIEALHLDRGIRIEVEEAYGQHLGLGSGTQIALAAGKAVSALNGLRLDAWEIARIVGRGGTSGIGVAAFEGGGFILDGGHSTKVKQGFAPSSASRAPPPPLLARHPFPWKVVLVIPRVPGDFYGGLELGIFQRYCPIPRQEVERVSHLVLMGLLPALAEGDIAIFGRFVNELQSAGFKGIEVGLQPPVVRELMTHARLYAPGVGLSSFGPTIYCILEDEGPLLDALRGRADVERVIVTRANNRGAATEVNP